MKRLLDRFCSAAASRRLRRQTGGHRAGHGGRVGPYGLTADVVPHEYRAESLAEALAPRAAGKRFLLARASPGGQVLPDN